MDATNGQRVQAAPTESLPSVASTTSPRRKYKRSSAGKGNCCRTCRLRKVKCGGNPGTGEACANCARLTLDCGFKLASNSEKALSNILRTTPSHTYTEAGTARKRAQRACTECHTHKTRCSGDLPHCQRCVESGLVCEYAPSKRRRVAVSGPTVQSESNDSRLSDNEGSLQSQEKGEQAKASNRGSSITDAKAPEKENVPCFVDMVALSRGQSLALKDILKQHFDAYLEHLFYLPCCSFLHPASTLQAIEDGTLPAPRAAALCAATTPFLNPGRGSQDFGARCIDQVELQIWRTMHTFSKEVLVLLALGMAYDFFSGSFAKPWQSIGVAVRLMLGLQTNWDVSRASARAPTSSSFVEQESTRRLAWFLFAFDRVLAGGYDEYISCRRETMKIRLPCEDQAYLDGCPVEAPRLDEDDCKMKGRTGIAGFGIYIIDLRHRIQVYTRTLSGHLCRPRSKREPSSFMSDINEFQNALSQLHACLPSHLRLTEQSIAAYTCKPEQAGYCYFHTHYIVAHIDLYRFALPGFQQKSQREALMRLPRDFIAKSQRQAISHAICLAKFCEDITAESEKAMKRGESGSRSTSETLKIGGDATIFHMATQGLRVLLVALQYRLYEGLDLAEHSTVPLWRHGPTNGPQIRSLIDSLIKIGEPWAEVLVPARHAHELNVAMVEQFDRTHRFADQPGTVNHTAAVLVGNGPSKLPGPHYLLDSMHLGVSAQEQRDKAHEAAAKSWWSKRENAKHGVEASTASSSQATQNPAPPTTGSGTDSPATIPTESSSMTSYGPPGVPMMLAQARGINLGLTDANMYVVDDSLQAMHETVWPMPDLSAMIAESAAEGPLTFLQEQYGVVDMPPAGWPAMMPGLSPYFSTAAAPGPQGLFLGEQDRAQQESNIGPFTL